MIKLTTSEKANPNYLATICRVEKIYPLENSDFLVKTVINGYDMIISKDTKPGSIVVYFPCESQICDKYLSMNNLYEASEYERNSNADMVKELVSKTINHSIDVIREHSGFFNKHGRVRMIKLRGHYSQGFIAGVDTLQKAFPELEGCNWEELVGTKFNMIGKEQLVQKYIPFIKTSNANHDQSHWKHRMKQIKKFDKLIPGQFVFHYDTVHLAEHVKEISPNDIITISTKVHGTSHIMSNILCKRKLNWLQKLGVILGFPVETEEYSNIYSSRSVIKNRYITQSNSTGFYEKDIWGCVNRDFEHLLKPGMTVYGEIVGYIEDSQTMIQKNHDYGCQPGQWKFMPYRITSTIEDEKIEWELIDVWRWTMNVIEQNPQLKEKILPIEILYQGKAADLYPDLKVDDDWHNEFLERLKTDKKYHMEEMEPMCKNKVPREGIVIRIENDKFKRAWKVKCKSHYMLETKAHDAGEVDIEETA